VSIDPRALTHALDAWASALGTTYVVRDHDELKAAGTATFATNPQVLGILRPGSRDEVQECVRIANRFRVPVYPVSSGKNWGYGSRAPVSDGALLDLQRLNRIVDFDEDLAYVTLEPGVTQRQLHEFLLKRKSGLWMDATGASPECSIIGNTLERGFGHTPMAEHCSYVCGFEVVLPSGECIDTGFSRFEGAKAGPLGRWGVGPSLDGLFSQSNLGIVTRMTVWLMPAPERFEAFFFLCRREDGLGPLIEALRPLRRNGLLRSAIHIGNDYKVLTATGQYPWEATGGRTPLQPELMEKFRRELGIGYWNGSGGLYGTDAQVREAKSRLRRALRGKVDRLHFVNDRLLGIMGRFATPFRLLTGWDVRRTLGVLRPVYNLLKGAPTETTLASVYWRKKGGIPATMDPDRDGCGLLWCSPVVPSTGGHAATVAQVTKALMLNHGFEPQISILMASERMLIFVITVSYDRDVPDEDRRAMNCYRALIDELLARGYPPYRLSVCSMDHFGGQVGYSQVLQSLKSTLDPNGVLAPGRYEPDFHRCAQPAQTG
jgi:4-cresol dehydrogenase (hydroxylating)